MYSVRKSNIELTRGDTFFGQITLMNGEEPFQPSAGDVIRFAMKKDYTDAETLILKEIPYDTLMLRLDPADTKPFPFGKYVYDIEITFADGVVDTFIKGVFTLTEEVE